jgi:hypothetical protein
MLVKLKMDDLIYPELSYNLVGCAFDVFNQLGPGHSEKVHQRTFAEAMRIKGINFIEQA